MVERRGGGEGDGDSAVAAATPPPLPTATLLAFQEGSYGHAVESEMSVIETALSPESIKLLNLAADWVGM